MKTLPPEVWSAIIKLVASPSHPLTYRVSPETSATLINLSLVNYTFHVLTHPVLYERVIITPSNSALFDQSLKSQMIRNGEVVRSLAPPVKSLACIKFDDSVLEDYAIVLCDVFLALGGTLQRLLLDMELRYLYTYEENIPVAQQLREALDQLHSLVELISARDEVYLGGWSAGPVCWTEWPRIQRIAFYNLEMDDLFNVAAVQKPSLDTLAILNPRLDWMSIPSNPIPEFLERAPSTFRRLVFLDKEDWGEDDYFPFRNLKNARALLTDSRFRLVPVDDGDDIEDFLEPRDWLLKTGLDGHLWDMELHSLQKGDPLIDDFDDEEAYR